MQSHRGTRAERAARSESWGSLAAQPQGFKSSWLCHPFPGDLGVYGVPGPSHPACYTGITSLHQPRPFEVPGEMSGSFSAFERC